MLSLFLISKIKSRLPRLHSCHLVVLKGRGLPGVLIFFDGWITKFAMRGYPDFVDAVLAVFIFRKGLDVEKRGSR